jgi:outer membrane lipoprotein SlyB
MSGFNDAPREIAGTLNNPRVTATATHPMVIIASIAVTVAAAVAIAVMTGVIPSAQSGSGAATNVALPTMAGAGQAAMGSTLESTLAPAATTSEKAAPSKPVLTAPSTSTGAATKTPAAREITTRPHATPTPRYETQPGSANDRSVQYVPSASNVSNVPQTPAVVAPVVCNNCGVIDSINAITTPGSGSGAGAILGGVVGGLLGHQVGGGRGKDVVTVAGAVGGAVIGNQIEKSNKASQSYDIRVRMDDATFQTIRSASDQGFRVGDKVRVDSGRLSRG